MSFAPTLVVFHMIGCPHCAAVTGSQSACASLRDVKVLEIESQHPLVEELDIPSFPTIWLSTPSVVFEYNGGQRTTDALQSWIASKMLAL